MQHTETAATAPSRAREHNLEPREDGADRDAALRSRATEMRAALALCRMTESRQPFRMPIARQLNTFAALSLELRDLVGAVLAGNEDAITLARFLTTEDPTREGRAS